MVRAISNPNEASGDSTSVFTPVRATKTLPLVRQIVEDLVGLTASIDAQREQLRGIDGLPETIDKTLYRDELADIRQSVENEEQRLRSCLNELALIGVVVHEPFNGFVDFPAVLNRRPVQLCWGPADEQVEYFHELGQSPSDRQKWDSAAALR